MTPVLAGHLVTSRSFGDSSTESLGRPGGVVTTGCIVTGPGTISGRSAAAHSQQRTVAGGSLWDSSVDAHDGTSIENNDNKLPESRVKIMKKKTFNSTETK